MGVAWEVLVELFSAIRKIFGKINWVEPSGKFGRSFSTGSNIDGTQMAGSTDIHGKQFGVTE